MRGLDAIPVEGPGNDLAHAGESGNVAPLLNEIRLALGELVRGGPPHTIDLRALPLTPGEAQRLERFLGRGEVQATLDALGPSEIHETAFYGVWLITHRNEAGEVVGRFIEITRFPSILQSQDADLDRALAALEERLEPSRAAAGTFGQPGDTAPGEEVMTRAD